MGNKHGTWSPEAWKGWTRHSEERYALLSTHRQRVRTRYASRRASRRRAFMETIEEEWLITDYASTSRDPWLVLQNAEPDTEPDPPETVPASGVTQPAAAAALMEQRPKEGQRETERIQEAKSDKWELPHSKTSPLPEGSMLPYGGDQSAGNSSTQEKELYYFYNRSQCSNPEEAKIVKVAVWNVDDMTPEGHTVVEMEEQPFESKERATEEEILAAEEYGTDLLPCKDDALQRRNAKETYGPQVTADEHHLTQIPQETLQAEITTDEEEEDRV